MIRALYSAATGMKAQETNLDVIANNMANVNTTSFKRSRADFQDLIYQYIVEPGSPTSQNTTSPSGIQIGLGVKTASVQKIFQQGDLTSTGNQLDLAIEGDGFFKVLMPPDNSEAYTRAGNFQLDKDGNLVTPDGYKLDPAIQIQPNTISVTIGEDGTVSARVPNQAAPQTIGNITPVRFPNNAGLRALGHNLYEPTESSGDAITGTFGRDGFGRVQQGFLESSNVSIVEQVVSMITGQRAYEASSKGIQAADEMLSQAINLKR
jgi:flagellar basal-body rod protein FlgG